MLFVLPLGPESDDLEDAAVTTPVVTWCLVGLCVLVYLVVILPVGLEVFGERVFTYGFLPEHPLGKGLLTHLFLHADIWNLVANMIFLAVFGVTVERRLGHLAVLLIFLSAGLAGAFAYSATAVQVTVPTPRGPIDFYPPLIGVSMCLMGYVGCLLPVMPRLRMRILLGFGRSYRVVAIEAWKVAGCYLVKEFLFAALAAHRGEGVAYGGLGGGLLTGFVVGGGIALLQRPAGDAPGEAREGTVGRLINAGRETGVVAAPPPARTSPAEESSVGTAPAAPAPVPLEVMDLEMSMAPPKPVGQDLIGGEGSSDEPGSLELPDEDELPTTGPSAEELAELETGLVDVGVASGMGMKAMGELGAVPPEQDYSAVSGMWAGSVWMADLQERIQRARRLERDPRKARTAFRFYKNLLEDRALPSGYRAYAGARAARLLLRRHNFDKAFRLATRLLKNDLPGEIRAHLYQTASVAWHALKKQASGQKIRVGKRAGAPSSGRRGKGAGEPR